MHMRRCTRRRRPRSLSGASHDRVALRQGHDALAHAEVHASNDEDEDEDSTLADHTASVHDLDAIADDSHPIDYFTRLDGEYYLNLIIRHPQYSHISPSVADIVAECPVLYVLDRFAHLAPQPEAVGKQDFAAAGFTSHDRAAPSAILSSTSALMSSPFAARLGTNYCPKDEEILEIKALLVEPTLQLKRLDEKIADLQIAIDRLAAERDVLGAFVDGHKALISPVRRLPLDIVQEIFVACLPTHRNCVMSAAEAPVLLGRICSSWRTISLFTPRLWARLHIAEFSRNNFGSGADLINKKLAQRLEVTEMWLGRAGQCPLSISLQTEIGYDSPPTTPSTSEPRSGQFLQALIAFAPRWQHIILTTPAHMLDEMAHLTAADVPMLQAIGLRPQQRFPPVATKWEMLKSPSISSFSISGNSFSSDFPLQWHRLTELIIDGPAWDTLLTGEGVLQTLSMCPALRSCKLVVNDGAIDGIPLPHSTVDLQFLHTLELDFRRVIARVPRLLERLSLPQLRAFTLHGRVGPQSSFSLAPFFGFWTHLESLHIDSDTFSKPTLLDSVLNLPSSLRQLSILDVIQETEFMSLHDDALALLAPCCPALETVLINGCSAISDAALLTFITARMTGEYRTTLKHIQVKFRRQMTLDILPSLEPFIETGLDVSITYAPPPTFSSFSPWQGLADAPRQPVFW
ncbi:hypothetical protein B0H19DRAFT_1069186 [Mycena capillaripes]|nr:hypothetical protein B0H19DRAFT_1069186 [Mycena capillaripes]